MSRRKANLEDHVAEDVEDCVAEDAGPLLKKARLEEDQEEEPSIWQQEKAREIIEYCKKSVTVLDEKSINWSKDGKERKNKKLKLFNDPIHGSILLNPLECAIINTPEFYRLRDIKQLGGKSHVYPGAVHTRFEHSIGVCHLAGEFVKHLRQPSQEVKKNMEEALITPEEEQCIRIAGLCHDLGHGPFSHIFDDVKEEIMKKIRKHEEISVLMFKKILLEHPKVLIEFVNSNLDKGHVVMIENMINCSKDVMDHLKGNKELKKRLYIYEIVANKSSGLDVDKWDYFARDCYFLGVKNEFDMRRCITLSKIVEFESDGSRHIAFRDKEYQSIYGMFRTRCMIYQKAISHKVVCAIEMMLKDAMVKAKDLQLFPKQLSLEKILQAVYHEPADLSSYVHLSDNILYRILCHDSKAPFPHQATVIVDRIINRDIYSCEEEIIIPGEQFSKITEAGMNKLKPELKAISNKEQYGYEINVASISYASEKKKDPDPVKEVHFYFKDHESCVVPRIDEKRRPPDSQVTTPKSFIEYRVRLFRKIPKISDDVTEVLKQQDESNKKNASKWFNKQLNEMKKVLSSCDCCIVE